MVLFREDVGYFRKKILQHLTPHHKKWRVRFSTFNWQYYVCGVGEVGAVLPEKSRRAIHEEYILFLSAVVVAIAASVVTGSFLIVRVWILPLLLVSEPFHFWIELPEHFGCSKLTDLSMEHTRTIRGSWFSFWFTNGNNLHVEHHLFQFLPIDQLPKVHGRIREKLAHSDRDYLTFFRNRIWRKQTNTEATLAWFHYRRIFSGSGLRDADRCVECLCTPIHSGPSHAPRIPNCACGKPTLLQRSQ